MKRFLALLSLGFAPGLHAADLVKDMKVSGTATIQAGGKLQIASGATIEILSGATVTFATNVVPWAAISKSGSSLADLATRSASDLSSGTLPDARFPSTLPAISGVNLTNLNASNLASGTVPEARLTVATASVFGIVKPDGTTISITAGVISLAGSIGTVTHTAGALTLNAVVLGAGSADSKTVAGIITDGTSKLTLGVAGSAVGSIDFKNATSGTITLQPTTGALGSATLTFPAATDTVAVLAATQSLTNKTLGSGTAVIAAISFTAGVKQTFAPDATNSGLNVGSFAGVPSSLANGDIFYDSTGGALKARIAGSTVSLGAGGGGGSGTVNSGATNQLAYYTTAGTAVSGADGTAQVRIGTASSTAATGVFAIYGDTQANTTHQQRRASADANGAELILTKARGSIASPTATQSADTLGRLMFGGYGTSAWAEFTTGVRGEASENWTNGANGSRIVFMATIAGSTTRNDALTLDTSSTFTNLTALAGLNLAAGGSNTNVTITPLGTGVAKVVNATNAAELYLNGAASTASTIRMQTNGTTKVIMGTAASANNILTGSATDDFVFRNDASKAFLFSADGSTVHFTITASTGVLKALATTLTDATGKILSAALNTVAVANGGTGTTTGSITGTGALTFTAGGSNTDINLAPNGTGRVIIGTPSSSFATGKFGIYGTDQATASLSVRVASASASIGGEMYFSKARGSMGSPTAAQSGDTLGRIMFGGYGSSAWQEVYAGIRAEAAENWTNSAVGSRLVFMTTPTGGSSRTDVVTIENTGVLSIASTLDASNSTTASVTVAGGLAVVKKIITADSIQTGAPSGGTAAAWKHGTVAVVSPTAPNRTIELDVAGTRYFLHAKTTND